MVFERIDRNMRDGFSEDDKQKLAGRAGHICSNPGCKQPTSGPSEDIKAVTNVGVAAHITAASEGGPRYNPSLTREQRSDIENGIWLCQVCAKAVDDDPTTYTVEVLGDWKKKAEELAKKAIAERRQSQPMPPINLLVLVHKAYFLGNPVNPVQYFFIKVVNNSPGFDVVITHVWYENDRGPSVEIMERTLPTRLKPFQPWETWVPAARIPELDDTFQRFRAKTSTGEVFTSHQNVDVRPEGYVAL